MRRAPHFLAPALLLLGTPLLLWPFVSSGGRWTSAEQVALLQIYVFASIAIYIVGRGMAWYPGWSTFAPPLITTGAVWAVGALFVLTFSRVQRSAADLTQPALAKGWFVATASALAVVAALMAWRYWNTRLSTLPLYRRIAFLWLAIAGIFVLTNLASVGRYALWFAVGYNVLAFAGVAWLAMTGIDRREPRLVNLGFALFTALIMARYAEFFWTWLGPVYLCLAGGVLLAMVAAFVEFARHRALAELAARKRIKR